MDTPWTTSWFTPGDWALPTWWTDNPPIRGGGQATHQQQADFFNGNFVKNVLHHKGGITTLPQS